MSFGKIISKDWRDNLRYRLHIDICLTFEEEGRKRTYTQKPFRYGHFTAQALPVNQNGAHLICLRLRPTTGNNSVWFLRRFQVFQYVLG